MTMERDTNAGDREIFSRVHVLISSWAEGSLDEADAAELDELLRNNRHAREIYFDYIQDTVLLGTLASRPGESGPYAVSELFVCDLIDEFAAEERLRREAEEAARLRALREQEQKKVPRTPPARKLSPAAYAIMIWSGLAASLAFMIWWAAPPHDEIAQRRPDRDAPLPPAVVATISSYFGEESIAYHADQSDRTEIPANVGTRLKVGKYSMPNGLMELRFDSGPSTVIQGPAEFELWAKNGMELGLGKAVTKVPPVAHGFAVCTSTASIIDLGTEFGVAADNKGGTEILVLDGKVALKSRPVAADRSPGAGSSNADTPSDEQAAPYERLLTAGSAVMVEADRTVVAIENPNRSKFLRSVDGLVVTDDFERKVKDGPLGGGIGFEDDWKSERGEITVQDGRAWFAAAGDAIMRRSFLPIDARSKPIYFSAEFQITGTDPVCSCWLALSSGAITDRCAVIGLTDGQFAVRLNDINSEESKAKGAIGSFTRDQWHFLVGRLQVDASGQLDELSLWIDPAVDVPRDPDRVIVDDLGYTEIDSLSVMFWDFGKLGESHAGIDNVRVGTSWEAVQ